MGQLLRKPVVFGRVCAVLFLVVCAYFSYGSFGNVELVGFGDHSDARVVLSKQLPVHDAVFKSSQKIGDLQSMAPLAVRATVSSLHVSIAVRQQSIYSWLYLLFDGTIFSRDYA